MTTAPTPAVARGAAQRGTVLLLSPHLDDAAFSAGATMAALADQGWRVVMATAFTRSVPDPQGFALACQLDKGLPAELDYMALRRAEDREAARLLGAEARWLDLLEAPHRGYGSAPALFGDLRADDWVEPALADAFATLLEQLRPELVLTCQGLGGHVDHRQVLRAAVRAAAPDRLAFWRDTPYVMRDPAAQPAPELPPQAGRELAVDAAAGLGRKVAASCAYASQVGFQFGGAEGCARALQALFTAERGERFAGAEGPLRVLGSALAAGWAETKAGIGREPATARPH